MAHYSFRNKTTGEEFDLTMTFSERDAYVQQHPELEQIIKSATPTLDPLGLGIQKPPSDFTKYVLGRIKDKTPGATAVGNRRFQIPREW